MPENSYPPKKAGGLVQQTAAPQQISADVADQCADNNQLEPELDQELLLGLDSAFADRIGVGAFLDTGGRWSPLPILPQEKELPSAGFDEGYTDFGLNPDSEAEIEPEKKTTPEGTKDVSEVSGAAEQPNDERNETIRDDLSRLTIPTKVSEERAWLIQWLVKKHHCAKEELFEYLRFFGHKRRQKPWNEYAIQSAIETYYQGIDKDPAKLGGDSKTAAPGTGFNKGTEPWPEEELTDDDQSPQSETETTGSFTEADSKKPTIQIPGEGRIIEKFVNNLLPILEKAKLEIFNYHGQCVLWQKPAKLDEPHLIPVKPQMLRGIVEKYSRPFTISRRGTGSYVSFEKSLSLDHAGAVVEHPQFLDGVRALRGVDTVRLPILRGTNRVDLLPAGYDATSGIYVPKGFFQYSEKMSMADAQKFIRGLLAGACFQKDDRERATVVVVAEMLTLYCRHFFLNGLLRPGFVYSANSEGAGKTTLACLGIIALLGDVSAGGAPKNEEEFQKMILAHALGDKAVLFLDNIKEYLSSSALERLMTAQKISGRLLGFSKIVEVPNNLTVVITGNNATYSPSLRRRLMEVELFLPEARFEDHQFNKELELENIIAARADMLSSLWAFVRTWYEDGCPSAPPVHGQFKGCNYWTRSIGSILWHAGFTPLASMPANAISSGDRKTHDIEELVKQMMNQKQNPEGYDIGQLINLAQEHELFSWFISPGVQSHVEPEAKRKFGSLLKNYYGRIFSFVDPETKQRTNWRFSSDLPSKDRSSRRFFKTEIKPDTEAESE